MKTVGLVVLSLLALVGVIGVGGGTPLVTRWLDEFTLSRNTNPPAYIRQVVAYKEGDGFRLYLTLADAQGALTRSAGTVIIRTRETQGSWDTILIGYDTRTVQANDFHVVQVGLGAFTRSTLVLDLGRRTDRDLHYPRQTAWLTVEITFEVQGRTLTGSTTVGL